MSAGDGPVAMVLGLLVGNVVYLLFTVILAMILGISPTEVFSGPFSSAANSLVSAWVAIGALLGVADVLAIVGFVASITGGGR